MDARSKECPSCKQQIQADASFCPFCGARFTITYQGYCPNCHTIRVLDQFNRCSACGSDVIDRQAHSQYLGDGQSQPATPTIQDTSGPPQIRAPSGGPVQPGKKPVRVVGCAGCARWGSASVILLLGLALILYTFSDDFRNAVRRLQKDSGVVPAATEVGRFTATSAPRAETIRESPTPFMTLMPHINLPATAEDAVCVGAYNDGMTCLDDTGWKSVSSEDMPSTGNIGGFASCAGELFVLVSNQVYSYSGGSWMGHGKYGGTVTGKPGCSQPDSVWIFDSSAAYHYDGTAWTIYTYDTVAKEISSFSAKGVAVVGQQVWAASDKYVVHFDGDTWTVFENKKDINIQSNFKDIAVDSQGNPWVAYSEGLSTFDGNTWTKIARPGTTSVNTVMVDPTDQVWVGTDGGVSMYQNGNWQRYPITDQGGDVLALAMDGQQRLWVGTDWGLGLLEKGKYTFYHMSDADLLTNEIEYLAALGNGPRLPEPMAKAPGSMKGRLMDGATPLKNARVEVCVQSLSMFFIGATPCSSQPYKGASTTDADGYFVIPDLPPGNYVFTCQAPGGGWKVRTTGMRIGSVFLQVKSGEAKDLGVIDISK